jgi:hypothetical protein
MENKYMKVHLGFRLAQHGRAHQAAGPAPLMTTGLCLGFVSGSASRHGMTRFYSILCRAMPPKARPGIMWPGSLAFVLGLKAGIGQAGASW